MDKDQHNEEKTQDASIAEVDSSSGEPQHEAAVIETDTVVVKKSGGTFSLLLSLVALTVAGYTLYQQWQTPNGSLGDDTYRQLEQQLQQLNMAQAETTTDLENVQNSHQLFDQQYNQLSAQLISLENQLNQLKSDGVSADGMSDTPLFDNSVNEVALRQLTLQLQNQEILINQLQSQLTNQSQEVTAEQGQVVVQDQVHRALAVKALNQAETLVGLHDIEAANAVLKNFLMVTKLDASWQREINQLSAALERTQHPDLQSLQQTLKNLESTVDQIQLKTETAAEDSSWYDRFVSVKKISDDAEIVSSAALMEFKLAIKRQLYMAQLMISMQDQHGWENSLRQAAELIQDNMPEQLQLLNDINRLAQQSLLPKVPSGFEPQALIAQLNGPR